VRTYAISLEGESPNIMKAGGKEEVQNKDDMGKFKKKLSISDNKFKFFDILGPSPGFVQLMKTFFSKQEDPRKSLNEVG